MVSRKRERLLWVRKTSPCCPQSREGIRMGSCWNPYCGDCVFPRARSVLTPRWEDTKMRAGHGNLIISGCKDYTCQLLRIIRKALKKGMGLYSAVSSPLDRSKRFTRSSPGRPVHSDTVLGFSWKHSSHAAIAQRLFTHISTTVYSLLIYTAESTEAS